VYRAPGAGGHDHVVRSPNFSGTFTYRVGNIDDCSVTVRVPVGALINDEDALRDEVGLADVSNDWGWNFGGGADAVKSNMLAENQLDASGHPNITFTSTACRGDANASGSILVDGDMTLKGVTRPVTWNVNLNVSSDRVTATGTLSILQSDFGITPYAFLGFKNDDEVDLEFDIVITD
jgi:polyisoprenoid-binding protein YceI